METAQILLVDDDIQARISTKKILELEGYSVRTAENGSEALELVRRTQVDPSFRFDLILSDVRMPKMGGLDFLKAVSICFQESDIAKPSFMLMTAFGCVEDAVWALKFGAVDFLSKPFKRGQLLIAVQQALKRHQEHQAKTKATRPEQKTVHSCTESISTLGLAPAIGQSFKTFGISESARNLSRLVEQVASTTATVLIQGESGTGKEVLAKQIHQLSARSGKPWMALNCAGVPDNLIESELFGHERGAFTGATQAKVGLLEAANGGTVFLDEIGDMPLSLQAKLLRVIQEREIRKLGATVSRKIDVRIIAATHLDLKAAVEQGRFRQDLLYRLDVVNVTIPPLRERMQDVEFLAQRLLERHAVTHGRHLDLSFQALSQMMKYSWPGNIRELSNVLERAVVLAHDYEIKEADLPLSVRAGDLVQVGANVASSKMDLRLDQKLEKITIPFGVKLKDVEEILIRKTLEATSGDKKLSAEILGISERTIFRKAPKTDL